MFSGGRGRKPLSELPSRQRQGERGDLCAARIEFEAMQVFAEHCITGILGG